MVSCSSTTNHHLHDELDDPDDSHPRPVHDLDHGESCDSGLGHGESLYQQLAWNLQNDENWLR